MELVNSLGACTLEQVDNKHLLSVTSRVGLSSFGVTYSLQDPRFVGSKPAISSDVGFFQDVDDQSTNPPGKP